VEIRLCMKWDCGVSLVNKSLFWFNKCSQSKLLNTWSVRPYVWHTNENKRSHAFLNVRWYNLLPLGFCPSLIFFNETLHFGRQLCLRLMSISHVPWSEPHRVEFFYCCFCDRLNYFIHSLTVLQQMHSISQIYRNIFKNNHFYMFRAISAYHQGEHMSILHTTHNSTWSL
jgi:hypothetical protein